MDKYQKDVSNVQNIINAHQSVPVELELSIEITTNENGQVAFPGIQIYVEGAEPIFISSGELKILAQASDKYFAQLLKKQTEEQPQKKTSSSQKTITK